MPIDHQAPAFLRIAVAGGEGDPGHGANTGQGLAAKTERTHGLEVLEPGDLAGGVARYGQGELVFGDARAIVPNPEAPYAPFFQFHLDAGGPGVDRVFHQLLQHGCRPLDHFSGGDLIRKLRRQQGYGHGLAPGNDQHLPHADAVRGEIVRRLKARRINAIARRNGGQGITPANFVARRIGQLGLPGGE